MISNSFNYYKNNKQYKIKEISFNDFKTFNKKLLNDDLEELNESFNELGNYCIVNKNLNCLEKFYCLMVLRTMTHGNEFLYTINGVNVNVNLNVIIDNINLEFTTDIEHNYNDVKYNFNLPTKFTHKTHIDFVIDCLVGIEFSNQKFDIRHYTYEEKVKTLEQLTFPVLEIFNKLQDHFKRYNFIFSRDFNFNVVDGSLLLLLKRLFYLEISSLYDFEYSCIRSLNISGPEFDYYTLPELRIFLQLLTKELKSKQPTTKELNS
jgi:hypothetical protein